MLALRAPRARQQRRERARRRAPRRVVACVFATSERLRMEPKVAPSMMHDVALRACPRTWAPSSRTRAWSADGRRANAGRCRGTRARRGCGARAPSVPCARQHGPCGSAGPRSRASPCTRGTCARATSGERTSRRFPSAPLRGRSRRTHRHARGLGSRGRRRAGAARSDRRDTRGHR